MHITAVAGPLQAAPRGNFEVEAVRWPVAQAPPPPQQPQHVGWLSRLFPSRRVGYAVFVKTVQQVMLHV